MVSAPGHQIPTPDVPGQLPAHNMVYMHTENNKSLKKNPIYLQELRTHLSELYAYIPTSEKYAEVEDLTGKLRNNYSSKDYEGLTPHQSFSVLLSNFLNKRYKSNLVVKTL